jgi:hypothetical protein
VLARPARSLARFPAPSVVVLARDRLAVASDSSHAVVIGAAIFAGLVAVSRVGRRVAAERGRGRARSRSRSWCRRHNRLRVLNSCDLCPVPSACASRDRSVLGERTPPIGSAQPFVCTSIYPACARARRRSAHNNDSVLTGVALAVTGPAIADHAAMLGLGPQGRTGCRQRRQHEG